MHYSHIPPSSFPQYPTSYSTPTSLIPHCPINCSEHTDAGFLTFCLCLTSLLFPSNSGFGGLPQKKTFWDNRSRYLQAGCPSCCSANSIKALKRMQSIESWIPNRKNYPLNLSFLDPLTPKGRDAASCPMPVLSCRPWLYIIYYEL